MGHAGAHKKPPQLIVKSKGGAKLNELDLYVTGKLTIGPMTNGDDKTVRDLAAELGIDCA